MNKKLTIFSIILIIVGIIGAICSGIASLPYIVDNVNKIREEVNKEHIIYNKNIDLNKIDISTINDRVTIKKHTGNDVKISVKGIYEEGKYEVNEDIKTLKINEKETTENYDKFGNLNELMSKFIENSLKEYYEVIVYVPNNIDISAYTKYGLLRIEDNIFLNEVKFKTVGGSISLPQKIKSLNKLDIISNGHIELSMGEIIGIKDINIVSNSTTIYSNDNDKFIDNIENYIPNNLNITSDYCIDVTTDIPIANNLNITSYDLVDNLDIPINKYKFNFNVKANSIDLYNLRERYNLDNDIYNNKNINEINDLLNKNLESLEKEYNINIKANNIDF